MMKYEILRVLCTVYTVCVYYVSYYTYIIRYRMWYGV